METDLGWLLPEAQIQLSLALNRRNELVTRRNQNCALIGLPPLSTPLAQEEPPSSDDIEGLLEYGYLKIGSLLLEIQGLSQPTTRNPRLVHYICHQVLKTCLAK